MLARFAAASPALLSSRGERNRGLARHRVPASLPRRAVTTPVASGGYFGVSSEDGTWFPEKSDTFQAMLRAAKGLRDVVQAGSPVLREPAKPVAPEKIGTPEIQELIEEMTAIMLARGVGLAAPQIGVPLQVVVLADTEESIKDLPPGEADAQERKPFKLKVLINPVVEPKPASGSAFFFEGCLSVQGYRALVDRFLEVEVRGLGGDGRPVRFTARGWQARILQHEYDHLQGTLYVDRMATRTFRRVDLVREPLPPPHPEFGSCPPLGVAAAGGQQLPGGARGKGFGGGARGPLVARPEGEGAAGKKKKK